MDADVALDADSDDGGADGDAVADADAEAEIDDGDATDADTDADTCVGGWYDSTRGLCWQNPPDETLRNWGDAVAYCDGLELGGRDDWQLPTVDDLRSLIRGCAATEGGGPCAATGTCLDLGCHGEPCLGCGYGGGPASGGAYWPSDVTGPVFWYWTSDACTSLSADAWAVFFASAYIEVFGMIGTFNVRCVHHEP